MNKETKDFVISQVPFLKKQLDKLGKYNHADISIENLLHFLLQFDSVQQIEIVIRLIDRIEVLDSNELKYLLRLAYTKVPEKDRSEALICSMGGIQDSSAMVCYPLMKEIFEDEASTIRRTTELSSLGNSLINNSYTALLFFDDNITSGTQLVQFFEELIDGKKNPEIVQKKLSAKERDSLLKIPIHICYAIRLTEECIIKVNEIRTKYGLDLHIHSGKVDYNNYTDFHLLPVIRESKVFF